MHHEKLGLSDSWAPYLAYTPLQAECSDDELTAFFNRDYEPSCGMCPARRHEFRLPNPLLPLGLPKSRSAGADL